MIPKFRITSSNPTPVAGELLVTMDEQISVGHPVTGEKITLSSVISVNALTEVANPNPNKIYRVGDDFYFWKESKNYWSLLNLVPIAGMPANTVKGAVEDGAPVDLDPVQVLQVIASGSITANNMAYVLKRGANNLSWSLQEIPEASVLTNDEIDVILEKNGFPAIA
jgi:hypothetical protein